MYGLGSTVVDNALEYNINPAFALAMFYKEAGFAKPGTRAYSNNNPGNIIATGRCRSLPARSTCNGFYGEISTDGRFGVYTSIADGIRAYFELLYREYEGLSINGIIRKYCPPTECDVDLYVSQINNLALDYQHEIEFEIQRVPVDVREPDDDEGENVEGAWYENLWKWLVTQVKGLWRLVFRPAEAFEELVPLSPAEVTRIYMEAIAARDVDLGFDQVAPESRAKARLMLPLGFALMDQLHLRMDISELEYWKNNNDDVVAIVEISGNINIVGQWEGEHFETQIPTEIDIKLQNIMNTW